MVTGEGGDRTGASSDPGTMLVQGSLNSNSLRDDYLQCPSPSGLTGPWGLDSAGQVLSGLSVSHVGRVGLAGGGSKPPTWPDSEARDKPGPSCASALTHMYFRVLCFGVCPKFCCRSCRLGFQDP